jgi:hypothetical protein
MINLTYDHKPLDSWHEDGEGFDHYPAAALSETSFEVPVQLSVDGVELLELHGQRLALPLLSVAVDGLMAVLRAKTNGASTYRIPGGGHLSFVVSGEKVTLTSTLNDSTATTSYVQLLSSWERFTAEIRQVLADKFPSLRRHPVWGPWFERGRFEPI